VVWYAPATPEFKDGLSTRGIGYGPGIWETQPTQGWLNRWHPYPDLSSKVKLATVVANLAQTV
jgi:hypothetical protein